MTTNELIDAIIAFLTDALGDLRLERQAHIGHNAVVADTLVPVKFYAEDLPDKDEDRELVDYYPAVLVRTIEGRDEEGEGTVTTKLTFLAFDLNKNGRVVLKNMMQRTRDALNVTRTIAGRYTLKWPLDWVIYEEQPIPEWVGEMVIHWTVPKPIPELPESDDIWYLKVSEDVIDEQ